MTDRSAPHFSEVLGARLSRRDVLAGGAAMALSACGGGGSSSPPPPPPPPPPGSTTQPLSFGSLPASTGNGVVVPAGYQSRTLIAWGDPLFTGVESSFDRTTLTRADVEQRFGMSNDMLALFPANWSYPWPATSAQGFILCANNEFYDASAQLGSLASDPAAVAARRDMLLASMGVSIVRVGYGTGGQFLTPTLEAQGAGATNRRITPFSAVEFDEPVRSHAWISSAAASFNAANGAPSGSGVACGTLANCAGGYTPWGTYLTAEENFQGYFRASSPAASPAPSAALQQDAASFGYSYSAGAAAGSAPDPYDLSRNPTGALAYGWVVEIDPYDPAWRPRKRTALGRRKAECATCVLSADNRAVVYSADDQADQFVYKFISTNRFAAANRTANRDLLASGKLYAARFDSDGTGRWIELSVTAANALEGNVQLQFSGEADLLIRSRQAARLQGATPMDRPEDVEAVRGLDFVGSGRVLVAMTNSGTNRAVTPANPRRPLAGQSTAANPTGHIAEIIEDGQDPAALTFRWSVFLLMGDPASQNPTANVSGYGLVDLSVWYSGVQTLQGLRAACPDNMALDGAGNVFIATDGSAGVFSDCNDQVLATPLDGPQPRTLKRFLVGPAGCEICGPLLTPDRRLFLCSIQHPGSSTGFPDGSGAFARPAVVCVYRTDGGNIGA